MFSSATSSDDEEYAETKRRLERSRRRQKLVKRVRAHWWRVRESGGSPGGTSGSDASRGASLTLLGNDGQRNIMQLPDELILKIFSYLPLLSLVKIVPDVCRKWKALCMDWTLWKNIRAIKVHNMMLGTARVKPLLRTLPNLRKLELELRDDAEELLEEVFETNQKLEYLSLTHCCRTAAQRNILSQTVTSILQHCPRLTTIILSDTYFHSKNFYRTLAKKFISLELVNVSCTSRSEMDVFLETLQQSVPEVRFERVPMMGKAAGKRIYWGPILGLVVRPSNTVARNLPEPPSLLRHNPSQQ